MAENRPCTATLDSPLPAYRTVLPSAPRHIGLRVFVGTGVTSVFIQACTVLQGVFLARLLGPTGRGELAAVILWPNIFAGIGSLGTDIVFSRMAARKHDVDTITRTAVLMSLCTAVVATFACFLLLPRLLPAEQANVLPIARLFLLFIPINHLGMNLLAIDQGAGNFRRFNIARMLLYPANLVLILLVWFVGLGGVLPFAAALLAANAMAVMYLLFSVGRSIKFAGTLFSLLRIGAESVRFGIARMVETLYLYADKTLLLWLLNVDELGLYTAAVAASGVINSVATGSGMVTFTIAAGSDDRTGFERVAEIFRAVVLVWLMLGGFLALTMPYLLPLVFGDAFAGAVIPAILLIPASALAGLASLLEQAMRGQGRAFVGVQGRLVGLALMVPVGFYASTWGIVGVCLAFTTAQCATLAVLIVNTKYHYGQSFSFAALVPTLGDARRVVARIAARIRK